MSDWTLVKSIFEQAVEAPPGQRSALLERLSDGDAALRGRVEALLAAHADAGTFLEAPTLASELRDLPPAAAGEALGAEIGPYRLVEIIGEGGFGTVYRAEQQEPVRRTVALKVLKPGMDTREVVRRFEAERHALALMEHPNIARALDAGATPAGRPYFVMELAEGAPITDYCDQRRLDLPARLRLMIDVCHAVQHAHQKGIIHRDIKPSNVLVAGHDGRPAPKVIDFGIAKAIDQRLRQQTLMTAVAQLIGTPAYMSPEQARLSGGDIDTRADIYSLGVLLYELTTGVLPFSSQTLRDVTLAEFQRLIGEVDPPKPSDRLGLMSRATRAGGEAERALIGIAERRGASPAALRSRLRGDLDWIVMKCLNKDRERRYASAADLARDLERRLCDEPVSAGPPGATYRLKKFARRHRAALIGASGALAALLVGLGFAISGFVAANRARHVAEAQGERAAGEALKAAAVNTFLQEMLASADPRQRGEDVTVRQVLHEAAERVASGSLDSQPQVEAAVRLTIGAALRELGLYDEAEVQLRAALDLARRLHGDRAPEVADALSELAEERVLRGAFEEAEALIRAALDINLETRGEQDPVVAANLTNLGAALQSLGRGAEAEDAHRQALSIARAAPAGKADALAEALNNLGLVLASQQRYDEAEPLYREALEINRARFGPRNPAGATTLDNLAFVLAQTDRVADAEALYREALENRLALFGQRHRDVAYTQHNLAHLLHYANPATEETEPLLRAALTTLRDLYGLAHIDTLTVVHSLASVYGAHSKLDEAAALMLEAYAACAASAETPHAQRRRLAARLAELYQAVQKPELSAEWQAKAASTEHP